MTIYEAVNVTPLLGKGSEISTADFGINLVLSYERFGTLPWEKFDEVQAAVGSTAVRFLGGSEGERLFDYANPNATSAVMANGSIRQLITTDSFLDYCKAAGTKATIDLPVQQLLTVDRYGYRDFDWTKMAEVRSFISHSLEKAGPQGIATFELGNEYEAYMTSAEYGRVASGLALITHQEIERYYAFHPSDSAFKPEVAVQVWGQSVGGTYSLTDLANRNHTVMAEFNADEMASVTAVTSHFYYDEGANADKPNYHIYSNITGAVSYSLAMMNEWAAIAGRPIDKVFSEWNLNMNDASNYGLQQVPIMLELFTAFVTGGVSQLDFWSTMYHETSLANNRGDLQTAGTLFSVMTHDLIGMKATEVPIASANYDIHAFSGHGKAEMFISSLIDGPMTLRLDIGKYLDQYMLMDARMMQVDLTKADGMFKGRTGLAPWEEADVPIRLTPQDITALLAGNFFTTALGAHETLILTFAEGVSIIGTANADRLSGHDTNDRIEALALSDRVFGMAGNDSIFGGTGNDTLYGGTGMDRMWGGAGYDVLSGGDGDDRLEGNIGNDLIHGGAGNDYIAGGDGSDTLWGDSGTDGFVFRVADRGSDRVIGFTNTEGDFLVYDGLGVSRSNFQVELRAVHGMGSETIADALVHFGNGGPVLWELQDVGNLTALKLLDTSTGTLLSLL